MCGGNRVGEGGKETPTGGNDGVERARGSRWSTLPIYMSNWGGEATAGGREAELTIERLTHLLALRVTTTYRRQLRRVTLPSMQMILKSSIDWEFGVLSQTAWSHMAMNSRAGYSYQKQPGDCSIVFFKKEECARNKLLYKRWLQHEKRLKGEKYLFKLPRCQ